jgi:hypothetical protein
MNDSGQHQADQAERPGQLVRAVRRADGEELRIELTSYQGHPFISVQLWAFNRIDKVWLPTRKGCSVRLREAREVARGLIEALELAEGPPAPFTLSGGRRG